MTRSHGAPAAADVASSRFATGIRWARDGWDEVRLNPSLWIGMSGLYLVPASLLIRLPFAGPLLVVLLTPMLLAGVLLAAERPKRAAAPVPVDQWFKRPSEELTRALTDSARVYPAVLMGIVTLGLVVVVFIVEHLVGIGSLGSLRSAATLGGASAVSLLIGVLVAGLLQVLLLMALFYAVHRAVFAGRDPLTAMGESFNACVRHGWAITGLTGVYALPYIVIAAGFSASIVLGYLLLYTVGLVFLPAFVLASYRSYRQIFPSPPARAPS